MKNFRTCFRGLARAAKPVAWSIAVTVIVGTVLVAASLGFVWASRHVVDIATGSQSGNLTTAMILMAAIMIGQMLCRVFISWWQGYIQVKDQNRKRQSLYTKVIQSSWDGQDRLHSGDTINRLEEDIRVLTEFVTTNLADLIITIIQLVAATAYLFITAPQLGWILIFIMPLAVVGSRLFFRRMRSITNEVRALDSSIQGHMQETIQNRILLKTLGCAKWAMERLGWMQTQAKDKTVTRLNYAAISRTFMGLGFSAGYLTAFLWGAKGLYDHTVTYGMMVAFLQLVGQVQRPVADIARHIPAFIKTLSSVDRLLDLESQVQEQEMDDIRLQGTPGVRCNAISFSYPDSGAPVIDKLSFDFKPGTITAIMGPTGAGKSTLIRLILSLLKPSEGSIELYEPATPASGATRCNFMYVPQGNSLLSGSIRENLLLAKQDATEEDMRQALESAQADFVWQLPAGLDTICSEKGSGLSEGQAQRIAIARAILHDGGIMILDEATSALDGATEEKLLERLAGLRGHKTIICVTHRPAVIKYADSVLNI